MNLMRVAGLIPIKFDHEKPDVGALKQLKALSDVIVVLEDDMPSVIVGHVQNLRHEGANVEHLCCGKSDGTWNDYVNRLTLLVRACAYNCDWVIWLDDDDLIEPWVDRAYIEDQIKTVESVGGETVVYRCRELWDSVFQYRYDGLYQEKRKIVLQKNPFLSKTTEWLHGPHNVLHRWPLVNRPIINVETQMLHFGMITEQLRRKRYERYRRIDPDNLHHPPGYDHIIDTKDIKLEPLKWSATAPDFSFAASTMNELSDRIFK